MAGLVNDLPDEQLGELGAKIDSGEVTTVFSVKEDLIAGGLTEDQIGKVKIVYLGTHENATSSRANVLIAGLTQFEKSGTVINQQFRLQKFSRVVPGPGGAIEDLYALATIQAKLSGESFPSTIGSLWKQIGTEGSVFEGISFQSLSDQGELLDGSAFEHFSFREGKSLHFEPKKEAFAIE